MPGLRLISDDTRFFDLPEPVVLEGGASLSGVRVAYRRWGRWDPARNNAVLVCHALTGSADLDQWWPGLLGPDGCFDPDRDFVLSSNVLGSCYGSTGPSTVAPESGRPYGPDFPALTVRDMVRVQARLLDHLGVERLRLVVGGSLGGMQALEWAASFPERVERVAAIATCARHSAWAIGLSEAQRAAIRADARFREGRYRPQEPPARGLAAARMMAMCSYRAPTDFRARFAREQRADGCFQVASYLQHHGAKLVERFDANSYLCLSEAMDRHDLGRGRGGLTRALAEIRRPVLVLGIDSDQLYRPEEQVELAAALPQGRLEWLHSDHGHDAFLIETQQVVEHLRSFSGGTASAARRLAS